MDKKDLKYWRECLKQALKNNDINHAMQCDKMITKLKKEKAEQGLDVASECYIQFNHKL
tara:strand:+ start:660 stop:836 length:177 start_codon:yes stop_codon:yes gene_type:complete